MWTRRKGQRACGLLRGTLLLLLLQSPGAAQGGPRTDVQWWGDWAASARLRPGWDAALKYQGRLGDALPNPVLQALGVELTWTPHPAVAVSPGYFRVRIRLPDGTERATHAVLLTATPTWRWRRLAWYDRQRVFWLRGGLPASTWYANRLRVELPTGASETSPRLFASDEVFFAGNAGGWRRNRFQAGVTHRAGRHWTVALYYQRQNDGRSRPGDLHTVGTQLEWRWR